ncbi:MAG: hypothetical protein ACRDDW_07495 [Candidatus Rhabdochlamydia sp.]
MKGLPSILKMDEAIFLNEENLDKAGFEAAQDLQTKMPIHNITFHEKIEQMGKTARCELQELLGDSLGGDFPSWYNN